LATVRTAEVHARRNVVTSVRDGRPFVSGAGSVWTIRRDEVVRLGAAGNVLGRIKVPAAYLLGVRQGSVWVTDLEGGVTRIDPESMSVVASIPLPDAGVYGAQPSGGFRHGGQLAFEADAAWVTGANALYRIDSATNRVKRFDVGIRDLSQWGDICLVSGRGSLWVRTKDTEVARVDPATGSVIARYPAGGGGGCIAVAFGSLWVANFATHSVWRIPLKE
jgi:streptogramin lyase